MKWPGLAKLVVSQVAIHRGQWTSSCVLDGADVGTINAFLKMVFRLANPAF